MKLYAGSDLHSNNNFLGIMDEQGKKIFKKRLPNDPRVVLEILRPFKKEMAGLWWNPPITGTGWWMR